MARQRSINGYTYCVLQAHKGPNERKFEKNWIASNTTSGIFNVPKHKDDATADSDAKSDEPSEEETEPILLHFDKPRNSKRTMKVMFTEIRVQIYDCLIDHMHTFGEANQKFVVHASIFDLRRIPSKDDTNESAHFMKEVDDGLKYLIGFCQKKGGLQYDATSDQMKHVVSSLVPSCAEGSCCLLNSRAYKSFATLAKFARPDLV